MDPMVDIPTISVISRAAQPLFFRDLDYAKLLQKAAQACIVLIGEASYGTHEFYRERAWITKRLITDYGFKAVAVEADWRDADRVNRFVMGNSTDVTSLEALGDFRRFPAYMWRNMDVLAFIEWLREHNQGTNQQVGFYGLDLYSLSASIQAVLQYLDKVDPKVAGHMRFRYSCFDQFGGDTESYNFAAHYGLNETSEREIVQLLVEMLHKSSESISKNGQAIYDGLFLSEDNVTSDKTAEVYYLETARGSTELGNLRAQHMAETLERLVRILGGDTKIVVWAHNSQLGDARATEMSRRGVSNLGELIRQQFRENALLVGFTTYSGELTAASEWDGPAERTVVNRALANSYEALFHETGIQDFLLSLKEDPAVYMALSRPRLERSIGVVYRPETERLNHYVACRLADQFDFVIHFDRTRALVPLEKSLAWTRNEAQEPHPHVI